jgi:hypothetical protein
MIADENENVAVGRCNFGGVLSDRRRSVHFQIFSLDIRASDLTVRDDPLDLSKPDIIAL